VDAADANREAAAMLGFTSAIGAYGAFFITHEIAGGDLKFHSLR